MLINSTWRTRLTAVALALATTLSLSAPALADAGPSTSTPAVVDTTTAASDSSAAAAADTDLSANIIGGSDATESYPFAARLLTTYAGLGVARCTGTFVRNQRGEIGVATNAHCVSTLDSGEAMPADTVQVQAGSTHLDQLTTIPATQVIVHPDWDWGTGDDAFADTAVVNLTIPAGLHITAIPIAQWARAYRQVRLLGWGKTSYDATQPPPILQQLDTHLIARSECAAAGITAGELCVAPATNGGQACFGDSGGPALGRRGSSWVLLGGASRVTDETSCTGASVYTDASYYAAWTDRALTGAPQPHHPRYVAPGVAQRYWALAG